jgi:hypothetical protein
LYDFHSSDEHVTRVTDLLQPYPPSEHDRVGCLRAFEAEVLALEVYRQVLLSDDLFRALSDDSAERFWSSEGCKRRAVWGEPIDLVALVAKRFVDPTSEDGSPRNLFPPPQKT